MPHLRWHLARLGIYTDDDALLEDIVVAQRERAKTLKEMAENSRFFFGDAVTIDPKAARETSDGRRARAAGRLRRAIRGARRNGLPRQYMPPSKRSRRRSNSASARSPSRCASRSRAGRVSPPIDQTAALLGRARMLGAAAGRAGLLSRLPG